MNIVLVAEEFAGIQLLRAFARTEDRIVAVMTSSTQRNKFADVASVARSVGVDVWPAYRVRESQLADKLRAIGVDLLLNAYSLFVISDEILAAPSIGAFNLHPGPLPQYAGLNCPSWAIYRGERSYGVSVHRMEPRIDAGPLAYQASFDIEEDETGFTLSAKCIRAGVPLIVELVRAAGKDPASIPAIPQDLSKRQLFGRQIPRGGALVWSEPARNVLAFVRAFNYYPFPSAWGHPHTLYNGSLIGVVNAVPTAAPTDEPPGTLRRNASGVLEVATADEWIALQLLHVNGRYTRADDVLVPGARFDEPSPRPTAKDL